MITDEKYELLNYKIKTLHLIMSNLLKDDCSFYSFIIDHDLSQQNVSIIFKSLSILEDRICENKTLHEPRELNCENTLEFENLLINSKPTYNEYETFIKNNINEELNVRYLLLALKRQGIHTAVCEYLLKDMEINK
ncbi:MAG: hypothetical protein AB6733_03015 [Clostridiaceae bacterium]